MSALLKFRFRWRAFGGEHELIVEAPTYLEACYKLGQDHAMRWERPPRDYRLDLSKPERVE